MTRHTDMASRGRIGGLTTAATHDVHSYTAAGLARANSLDRWLERVPTDLPEGERMRRAEALRKLHYATLQRKSVKARTAKKAGK